MILQLQIIVLLISLAHGQPDEPFPGANQPCYDTENNDVQGFCEHTECCAYDYYISNLCPSYPNSVKCCYSVNSCSTSEGCDADVCLDRVKELACEVRSQLLHAQVVHCH